MSEASLFMRRMGGDAPAARKIRKWINIPELLPKLRERGLVDGEEREQLLLLHRERNRHKQLRVLRKALAKQGPKAFVEFHGCLLAEKNHMGHWYAADLLGGTLPDDGEHTRKSELIQETIRRSESVIQASLNLPEILPRLLQRKLVTQSEYDMLTNERASVGRSERIQELLTILDTKGPHSFSLFLKCLQEEQSHCGHTELYQSLMAVVHEQEKKDRASSLCAAIIHPEPCTDPLGRLPGHLGPEGQLAKRKYVTAMRRLQRCRYMGEWEDFRRGIDELTRSRDLDIRTMGTLHRAVASIMEGKTEQSLELILEAESDCNHLFGNNKHLMSGRCLYIRSAVYRHLQDYSKAQQYLLDAKKVLDNALPGEDTASLYYHMGTLALDSISRADESDSQRISAAREEAERNFALAIAHAECEESGLPLIGWHSRVFLVLLRLGSSHRGVGQGAPSPQDLEKAEGILRGIDPKKLPWRTLALYRIASSDIFKWKGDIHAAMEEASYGLGVAETHKFAFESKFATNRINSLRLPVA